MSEEKELNIGEGIILNTPSLKLHISVDERGMVQVTEVSIRKFVVLPKYANSVYLVRYQVPELLPEKSTL